MTSYTGGLLRLVISAVLRKNEKKKTRVVESPRKRNLSTITSSRFSQYQVVLARKSSSLWPKNVVLAVVSLLFLSELGRVVRGWVKETLS